LGTLLKGFQKVVVPELNNGQLVRILRSEFLVDAIPLTKIQGKPFLAAEIEAFIQSNLQNIEA
jgi:2-oxoglutarate ferredoxin oxidoreductase subunit alpha